MSEQFPWLQGITDWYDETPIPDAIDTVRGWNQTGEDWAKRTAASAVAPYFAPTGDRLAGQLDAAATVGQNAANTAAAGFLSLPQLANANGVDDYVSSLRHAQENFGRQPQTPVGQMYMNTLQTASEPVEATREAMGALGEPYGPAAATAGYMTPEIIAALTGSGAMRAGQPKQVNVGDLFPNKPRIGGPAQPNPMFDVKGPTGRGGPGARQEGAIRITGRNPDGSEIYEAPKPRVTPIVDLYRAPKIDIEGNPLPNQPIPAGVAENPLFVSAVPEAMKRSKTQNATPQQWLDELKTAGVDEKELGLTGVKGALLALPESEQVSRQAVVDAYNEKDKNIEMWRVGPLVQDPVTPEMQEGYKAAEETYENQRQAIRGEAGQINETEGVMAMSALTTAKREGVHSPEFPRNDYPAIPDDEWAQLEAVADRMLEAKQAFDEPRLERQRLMKHTAGQTASPQGEGYPGRPFSYWNSWMSGGSTGGNTLSLTELPRGENSVFRKGDKPWDDLHTDHYYDIGNKPDWMNAVHSRVTQKPVMSVPPYKDESGQEWRPTTLHGDEPWQPDAFKNLRMPGEPGYDPTGQYSGLAKDPLPSDLEKMTAAEAELDTVKADITRLNNMRKRADDLYSQWPGSVDRIVMSYAEDLANLPEGSYSFGMENPQLMQANELMLNDLLEGNNPDTRGRDRTWAANRQNVIDYLDKKVNGESDGLEETTAQLADLNRRRDELNNTISQFSDDKLVHENMPFATKKEGLHERAMAGMMNQLAMAIENGDDFISLPSMRSHALSYYYTNVGPDAETLFRFGPESVERELSYDPRTGDFYASSQGGEKRHIPQRSLTTNQIDELRNNAHSYEEWRLDAKDKWVENRALELTNNGNLDKVETYKTTDGIIHQDYYDAYYHQRDLMRDRQVASGQFPMSINYPDERAYRYARDNAMESIDGSIQDAVTMGEGYKVRGVGQGFETIGMAMLAAENSARREIDGDYDAHSRINAAPGVTPWDEVVETGSTLRIPRDPTIPPQDEPMLPIQDVPIEEYKGREAGGPRDPDLRARDLDRNAKNTYIVGQMYYKDAMIVRQMKTFLRNALGMTDKQIGDVMVDIEHATGDKSSGSADTPWQLYGQPRMRSRAIRVTPELKEAFNKRGPGGMFTQPAIKDKPAPKKKAERPNPGKIQKAYAQGKLTKDEAIAQLTAAGVPERAIANMIR